MIMSLGTLKPRPTFQAETVTYTLAQVLKICDCQVRAREGNGVAADDTRVSSTLTGLDMLTYLRDGKGYARAR